MSKPQAATSLDMPFEQALKELETIVRKLEGGTGDLNGAINDYVRGNELKAYCQQKLSDARLKVETIIKAQDGSITTKPLDAA